MDVGKTRTAVTVAGVDIQVEEFGQGEPALLLHRDIGSPKNPEVTYAELAKNFRLLLPHHPGFCVSDRVPWIRSVRDIATLYHMLLDDMNVRQTTLLGFGFGGWIAAQMATMSPATVDRLILAAPMGVQPTSGAILDQALVGYIDYVRKGFHADACFDEHFGREPAIEQVEEWDICREMCFRMAWKPYMYDQSLPFLLRGVKAPTLVVWGDDDRVVPPSAGTRYLQALPNARLETVKDCGHLIDLERPKEFASLVHKFVSTQRQ